MRVFPIHVMVVSMEILFGIISLLARTPMVDPFVVAVSLIEFPYSYI
jgi:hypothetical protein